MEQERTLSAVAESAERAPSSCGEFVGSAQRDSGSSGVAPTAALLVANSGALAIAAERPPVSESGCARDGDADRVSVPAISGNQGLRAARLRRRTVDGPPSLAAGEEEVTAIPARETCSVETAVLSSATGALPRSFRLDTSEFPKQRVCSRRNAADRATALTGRRADVAFWKSARLVRLMPPAAPVRGRKLCSVRVSGRWRR
jgi:hypothetical protein